MSEFDKSPHLENEKTFRLGMVVVAVSVFALVALPTACTMQQTAVIGIAIQHGVNPLDAVCAVSPSMDNRQMCMARALAK